MYKTKPHKVEGNELRQALIQKGYSMRTAAKALGVSLNEVLFTVMAHDPDHTLSDRIKALPSQKENSGS